MMELQPTAKPSTQEPDEWREEGEKKKKVKPFKIVRRRVTLDLPGPAADTLSAYADRTGRSKTEFVRASVGVFALLCDEIALGNRVIVMRPDGKTLVKELILPT